MNFVLESGVFDVSPGNHRPFFSLNGAFYNTSRAPNIIKVFSKQLDLLTHEKRQPDINRFTRFNVTLSPGAVNLAKPQNGGIEYMQTVDDCAGKN